MLSENTKDEVRMTLGFSLYAIPLQVILVIYFEKVLGELRELKPLEDSNMCYY